RRPEGAAGYVQSYVASRGSVTVPGCPPVPPGRGPSAGGRDSDHPEQVRRPLDVRQVVDGAEVVAEGFQDRAGCGGVRGGEGDAEEAEAQAVSGVVPGAGPRLGDLAGVVGDQDDVAAHPGRVVVLLLQDSGGGGQRALEVRAAAEEGLGEVEDVGDGGRPVGREAVDAQLVGGGEEDADEVASGPAGLVEQGQGAGLGPGL